MAQQVIAIGPANGQQGDPPFVYCTKINANFGELYGRVTALESANYAYQPLNARLTALANGTIDGIAVGGTMPASGAFTTLTATSPVGVASGGTGGNTQATARAGIGAAASGVNSDITSLTGLTTPIPVAGGGTGGGTQATARSSLGAAASGSNSDITALSGLTTPLSAGQGGTGYGSVSAALDGLFSSTQGAILYRGASAWLALSPGTVGQSLTSGGAGANPFWATAAGYTPNRAFASLATYTTVLTAIPVDDTIPQSNEGTQVLSVSIAPKAATSRIRIRFQCFFRTSAAATAVGAIFDGGANALQAAAVDPAGASSFTQMILEHEYVPGSTAARTISVRMGVASGSLYLNGNTSTRLFGGSASATLVVEEVSQ